MPLERICICAVQVPFVKGGAEYLVEALRGALISRGYSTEVVNLPFKWYPSREILSHALAWRLMDLTESQGHPIDLVIATKFPSYLVRHPNKVTWLFHQFRQAYDLYGTPYGELSSTPEDQRVRDAIRQMDSSVLLESQRIFTIAENVSNRLRRYNNIGSTPLHPPPPLGERYRCETYSDFVLTVGRLDAIKRTDLLLQALKLTTGGLRCVIAGTGPEREALADLCHHLGLDKRVTFAGSVSAEALLAMYAQCRLVFYAPYDEDFGLVPLEALRSRKPVLTTEDAGGALEFVRDGDTGAVTAPTSAALAAALDRLGGDVPLCQRLGENGYERVKDITWDGVLEQLLSAAA